MTAHDFGPVEAADKICRECMYWAPEIRAAKLLDWLAIYGEPLAALLRALPADERKACGIDEVVARPRVNAD